MEENYKIPLRKVFCVMGKSFLFMESQKARYAAGAVFSFAELGMVYLMPLFISGMIVFLQNGTGIGPLFGLFFLFFLSVPLVALGKYWMGTASYYGLCRMKRSIFERMLTLPIGAFDKADSGAFISRLSIDADKAGGMFRGYAIVGLFKFLVYESVGIVVLLLVDTRLLLVSLLFCLVSLFFTLIFNPWVRRLEGEGKILTSKLMSLVNEAVNGVLVIKMFPVKEEFFGKCKEVCRAVYRKKSSFRFINGMGYALVDLFSLFLQPVGFLAAIWLLKDGKLTVAQAVLAANVMGIMGQGTKEFNAFLQYIQSGIVSAGRIFEFLDGAQEDTGAVSETRRVAEKEDICEKEMAVCFHDVVFSYRKDRTVLNRISLEIPRGSAAALVGESGSGKSTILKLLLGFYLADFGTIEFLGRNLGEYTPESLRRQISYVPQNPSVIEGTILENLTMGNLSGYSMEQVDNAVQMAGLNETIASLPEGYKTKLGTQGIRLSGGQRQRLAIARAILEDAPVVLMDEATSALDSQTEMEILRNLKRFFSEKTVIISAHRLYTVQNSDTIFVIQNGKIKGTGTHEELVRANAYYQRLCQKVIH